MAVESKVIITAEDRTAHAFSAIERNTGKTALALTKLTSNMLQLAGVGSLLAFFRTNAEGTEKWRDEMARLDDITKKFFNSMGESGRLDPFIQAIKTAHVVAMGLGVVIEDAGLAIGALAAAAVSAAKFEFAQARNIMKLLDQDLAENHARLARLRQEVSAPAAKGYANNKDEEAEAAKEAKRKQIDLEREMMRLAEARDKLNKKSGQDRYEEELQMRGKMMEAVDREEEQANEKLARERERLQKSVEQVSESFMTEQELAQMQYESKQMMLDDAYMRDLITAEEHTRQKEQLELQHQANMGNISAKGAVERRRFEEMNALQKTQFIVGTLLTLTQGVATHNKTMFQINKVAGIANAVINTALGVTQALKSYPPPLSFAMAAVQLAAGVAQIQQIKSASFGDSSSAPSIGGGSAVPVTPAENARSPEPVPPMAQSQFAAPARDVTVMVQSDSGIVTTAWIRDYLFPGINDALGDGVTLNLK